MNQASAASTREFARVEHPAAEAEFHWHRWFIGIVAVLGVIVLFYMEESWRGKRAWERYKQSVEAAGGTIDWKAYLPTPVPSDQNFFEAPNMAQWFVGRGGTTLSSRLTAGMDSFLQQRDTNPVAEVTIVSPDAVIAPDDAADAVFDFTHSTLTIASMEETTNRASEKKSDIIPLIVIDEVPLKDTIKALARQDNLNYALQPGTDLDRPGSRAYVSVRWTNITAHDALVAVLNNYNLRLIPDSRTGVARIERRDLAERSSSEKMAEILQRAVTSATNHAAESEATAASMFTVFVKSPPRIRPARIFVRAARIPSTEEVSYFFQRQPKLPPIPGVNWGRPHVQEVAGKPGSFRVWYTPAPYTSATDFLAWSDQFEPEFDELREALKRPYARLPGSYQDPVNMPIPNFVTVRIVAQKLSERAECHLLLGQPELALRDLTLIRDSCRLLEGAPAAKPMTLVAAMINVAVSGLYVGVVEEGLRMNTWQEPQLAAIEEQLKQIDLPPFVVSAFECERASSCHVLEEATPKNFQRMMGSSFSTNVWERLKDPQYMFLTFAPRGWTYQNMTTVGLQLDRSMAVFDLKDHLIVPHAADRITADFATRHGFRPFSLLAEMMILNFVRAWQTTAKNQTLVNEAMVVCALERQRLALGEYPKTLASLEPKFLEKAPPDLIGGKPLKYHRTPDGQFVLYSIGWNEKDDGGTPGKTDANGFDPNQADWVWPYHQKLIK
ncbi:MAG TPA: hypothetical protein VNX28_01635 [Gemmataceae bacterium]|nr:hypothetical protein [Gemmataceae bacterium]